MLALPLPLDPQISGMFAAFASERSREVGAALREVRQQVAKSAGSVSAETTSILGSVAASAAQFKVGDTHQNVFVD